MCLKLEDICVSYGERSVLSEVCFEVRRGEVVAFLGLNGAGKSTCLRVITGSIAPLRGCVKVCGFDLALHPLEARRCMGYLPENNPLYPDMLVAEYLSDVAGAYSLGQEAVVDVLHETGLATVAGQRIGTLSRGFKQRVGWAQALLHHPQVLVLDEPFSGLDPGQAGEMHELLRRACRESAVLFSTHALGEIGDWCDRVLVLHGGRIVADAPLAELRQGTTLEERFRELTSGFRC